MRRTVCFAAFAIAIVPSALACAPSASPPARSPEPTAAPSAPAASEPESAGEGGAAAREPARLPAFATQEDLATWLSAPCFAYAAPAGELGCVEAVLDMGFVEARFVILSAEDGRVLREEAIYSGRSDIDAAKIDRDALGRARDALREGGFTGGGRTLAASELDRTPDGRYRIEGGQVLVGPIPGFTASDAPDGFEGDVEACMRWEATGGVVHDGVAVVRVHSRHTFVDEPGQRCHSDAELSDESFPAQERWLLLRAEGDGEPPSS